MPRKKKEAEEPKEVKKTAAKKNTAKAKTGVNKEVAPAKKVAAKKETAPAKNEAAPTKKDATKKETAPAKKAAAPTKKAAAPTKKAATKKEATPAKKVEAKKTAPKKTTAAKSKAKSANAEPKQKKASTKNVPTVRYSDEDLDMFANVIRESRREALDELRMLKERLEDLTNYDYAEESMIYSMHMAEQGSEAMEKEKTYAQIQRINEYLKKLDDALNRIQDKTYGICRVCNCLIAKARLLAVQITTLSASYKIHQKCPEDGIDKIEAIR